MANYDRGDAVRVTAAFVNAAGTATDPTTVTLTVRPPGGPSVAYTYAAAEITKDSTGNYSKVLSPTASGSWGYRWTGTGAVQTEEERHFSVRNRTVADPA